jgi:hypothetical protein
MLSFHHHSVVGLLSKASSGALEAKVEEAVAVHDHDTSVHSSK